MRIRTFFKKIAACTLSAAVLLSPASALGADIQTDMTSAESQDTESAASETEDLYGVEAYANLEAIYQNFPQRINDENNRSENVTNAGLWIQSQLESYGYEVSTHDFTHFNFTGTNYFVTKPGKSDKTIIIGAHYDSMPTAGVDDNGGEYDEDGKLTREWVYDEANLIADDLGLDLYTLPEQVTEFQSPTRLLGSDSYYFAKEGIPYLYMEASLWCNDDGTGGNDETHLTCHYQTANEAFASTGGQIMHTEFDDLNHLNELLPGRVQKNLHDASSIVTGMLLDISPNTEAGIAAGKAAASAAAQEESSSTDNSIDENVSEDSSFENDTSESIESETQNASLDEPNESAAPVIESDHKFMTGLFAAAAIVLILFVVFLLTAALTANQRRRKRIRRFGEDYKKKKY